MFKRLIASIICICFIFNNLQYVEASSALLAGEEFSVNQLPVPGKMVDVSSAFSPLALKGLVINPAKPLEFKFIVDSGHANSADIRVESNRLIKYFLAGLTIPEGDLWVNLSPYEKDRIIPQALGQTELGRDLLAQDYILKQLTASLIYPEKDLGKEFWSRVYKQAQDKYGTTDIPINTLNKVWILPDQAQVFENGPAVYVTKSTLKVMLDEDYLAKKKVTGTLVSTQGSGKVPVTFFRDIILPEITKEINSGRNFGPLRQIYHAMILAKWYKQTIANGLLDAVYTNKQKTAGINLNDPSIKQQIYDRYLQAYKKGVFNYIKEDQSSAGPMPRKYFSGGITKLEPDHIDRTGQEADIHGDGAMMAIEVKLDAAMTALKPTQSKAIFNPDRTADKDKAMVGESIVIKAIINNISPNMPKLSEFGDKQGYVLWSAPKILFKGKQKEDGRNPYVDIASKQVQKLALQFNFNFVSYENPRNGIISFGIEKTDAFNESSFNDIRAGMIDFLQDQLDPKILLQEMLVAYIKDKQSVYPSSKGYWIDLADLMELVKDKNLKVEVVRQQEAIRNYGSVGDEFDETIQKYSSRSMIKRSVFINPQGVLVGRMSFIIFDGRMVLTDMGVLPSQQGQDIGTFLLSVFFSEAYKSGKETISIEAEPEATKFYTKFLERKNIRHIVLPTDYADGRDWEIINVERKDLEAKVNELFDPSSDLAMTAQQSTSPWKPGATYIRGVALEERSFVGLSQNPNTTVEDKVPYIGSVESAEIFKILKDNGYIDSEGKVPFDFKPNTKFKYYGLPRKYSIYSMAIRRMLISAPKSSKSIDASFTNGGIDDVDEAMISKQVIMRSERLPKPLGPYPYAVRAGSYVFISGQGAREVATNKLVEGGNQEHVKQAFANLKAVLEASGSSLGEIVRLKVFITDINLMQEVNQIYHELFGTGKLQFMMVKVDRLPADNRLEVEAITQENDETRQLTEVFVPTGPLHAIETKDKGIQDQARDSFRVLKAHLARLGSSLDQTVKVTIHLRNMDDFEVVNQVYKEFFNENNLPARTVMQIGLPKDELINVEAVGIRKDQAMVGQDQAITPGGIDFNQINVNRTGSAIKMNFDPAQLNELLQGEFEGFMPVIINITPIQSPLPLLGVVKRREEQLAKI